jgi:ABC-type phosphate/phosphonate transport system ATPase subunit
MNRKTKSIIDLVTGNPINEDTSPITSGKEKNPAAVALGKLGGLKGGKARAEKLSPGKRTEIAKKAARSRWSSK